jgi:hypothetical protein
MWAGPVRFQDYNYNLEKSKPHAGGAGATSDQNDPRLDRKPHARRGPVFHFLGPKNRNKVNPMRAGGRCRGNKTDYDTNPFHPMRAGPVATSVRIRTEVSSKPHTHHAGRWR